MITDNSSPQIISADIPETSELNPLTRKTLNQKQKIIIISIFAFIILVAALFGGYYLGQGDNNKANNSNNADKITITPTMPNDELETTLTPTPTPTLTPTITVTPSLMPTATKQPDICVSAQNEILNLIIDFENYQKQRNANAVLALFTPAQTQAEISDYQSLSGQDGLYNNVTTNYKTPAYIVMQKPEITATNTCNVGVREQRSYYVGTENDGAYDTPAAFNFNFIVVKQNDMWKVDRYWNQDPIAQGKYDGFTMEYN